ncbi:MAG: hypothetical protein ACREQY_16250 [Candidatus Binatia bacterium]
MDTIRLATLSAILVVAQVASAQGPAVFQVGAAKVSLAPDPAKWQTSGCTTYGVDAPAQSPNEDHLLPSLSDLHGWPAASPDCVYLGGFGLGPVKPAAHIGHGGVWIRAVAISNGQKTFVYGIADLVGWFARYDGRVCPSDDCGIRDIRERIATQHGLDVGDVILGATHTHHGADAYGGWGGIPVWYREQIRDAAVQAASDAIAAMTPATITVGELHLRNRNNERRDTYYSTADTGATWLQARCTGAAGCDAGAVIATWATYAGHPTIVNVNNPPFLHADWPGASARRFEAIYGGVGLLFEGGLGNVSVSGAPGAFPGGAGITDREVAAENTGIAIANAIAADVDQGTNGASLSSSEMIAATKDLTHPAMTNPGLTTLATVGLFDREFTPATKGAGLPGTYFWSRAGELSTAAGEDNDAAPEGRALRGCLSTGPTVITTAGAHRIGEFTVAFAPGEIFSNIAEVVKEKADNTAVTMVLGQTNDSLGYIVQSFEFDTLTNAATHYGLEAAEYEEVFSIDRCFGDHVLETMLESTRAVGAGG